MIKRLILIICPLIIFSSMVFAETKTLVEKYELNPAKNFDFTYGSGLAFKKSSPYGGGILMFYLTPNGEFQITDGKDQRTDATIPHIAIAKLKKKKGTFEVTDRFPLYFEKAGSLNVNLQGISTAPNDLLWLVDSKQNALIKVNLETGEIQQVIKPGEGLPALSKNGILKSVAVTPNGKVYLLSESPFDFEGEASSTAKFIRLVEFDPLSNTSKTFALPVDRNEYVSVSDIKISDLQAVDKKRLLAIEQGKNKSGEIINRVILIKISGATDISELKFTDQELEYANTEIFGANQLIPKPLEKTVLVDLNKLGWKHPSAEGLALVDAETIAVTNSVSSPKDKTEIWLISLPQPLYLWSWKEWALFLILGFILVFSSVLTFLFVFKSSPKQLA